MKNIFDYSVSLEVIDRIHQLNNSSKPKWGKMNVAQMLAHCNVTYELAFENKHKRPNWLVKLLLKAFVKKTVVNEVPFKKNGQTAPVFLVSSDKDFEREKERLINYITKTQQLGADYFNQRESHSFGPLSSSEWNNMFYKHLDHHLHQFGV